MRWPAMQTRHKASPAPTERVASPRTVQDQPEENKIARHGRRFTDRRQGRVRGELRGRRCGACCVRLRLQDREPGRRARRRDRHQQRRLGRRDEHPADGAGEPDRLPGPDPVGRAARRDARGQRLRRQQPGRRRPGHQHADPAAHLRRRAEGGRLLDPARRLGHLPPGVRRAVPGQDRPGLRPRLRAVAEPDRELLDELRRALPEGQPGRPGGHDRHRAGGHRPEDRPLRRGEPGRVLLPGRGVRRHRGVHQAVERRRRTCTTPTPASTPCSTATT